MSPLWRFVRKLFGKPKGRHAMGVAQDPAPVAPVPEPARFVEPTPEPEPEWLPAFDPPEELEAVPAPEPTPVVAAMPAPAPAPEPAEPVADLGPVRLIFSDGTIAPLPAGSVEERRARYLAQRVLEAIAPHPRAQNGQNSL